MRILKKETDYIYKRIKTIEDEVTSKSYNNIINRIYMNGGTPLEEKLVKFIDFLKSETNKQRDELHL